MYDFIFGDAFNDLSVPYHLTTLEFAALLKKMLKPDGMVLANVIDSYKRGLFLPSYMKTLEEVFGKGSVHLVTTETDYSEMETGTYVVLAGPHLKDTAFLKAPSDKAQSRLCHVMPQQILQEYLTERSPIVLTDDYVPVDNLIAPVFEERFGYRR